MSNIILDNSWLRIATSSPKLTLSNPTENANELISLINTAFNENVSIIVFPELAITGYTCGDLFNQSILINQCLDSLKDILNQTKSLDIISIIGIPLIINDRLFNCAVICNKGKIFGIVPKLYLPNSNEFYEQRWFTSGFELNTDDFISKYFNYQIPIGANLLFNCIKQDIVFSIEICEDLWSVIPNSSYSSLAGSHITFNLSASNELVGKSIYRRELVLNQSARCNSAYVYSSSGFGESTTDTVFVGHCIIAENGKLLAENFNYEHNKSNLLITDLDIELLKKERLKNSSFKQNKNKIISKLISIEIELKNNKNLLRKIDKNPFVSNNEDVVNKISKEIFDLQVIALSRRILHTNSKFAVIGISGGLDSTLALLITVASFDKLSIPRSGIIAVTMPGFGTTNRTYRNAKILINSLNCSFKEISIKESVNLHFTNIDHEFSNQNVVFENTQARERTNYLMNLANKFNGFVVGTGDLSESALGWCTFNGDHISMYHVNIGIPKTLVQYIIKNSIERKEYQNVQVVLQDILNTPISPELLPLSEDGEQNQSTESILGNYEVHDFILYYTLRYGFTPKKIFILAKAAFEDLYLDSYLLNCFEIFYKRFISQQFKRSVMPDGPKIGSISLSPRADWRMPSDINPDLWYSELNHLKNYYSIKK
jgi:NAD+ synthase (glutamine-hydrolysing)